MWLFAILLESLNVWLYICNICMWLNGYFTSLAAAVLVVRRRYPSSSTIPNDLRHRPINHSAGPCAHLCNVVIARSQRLEPGKPPSPARRRFFPVLARAIPRETGQGVCLSVTIVRACIAPLHGLQINYATLKWLPSAGHTTSSLLLWL